MSLYPPPPPPKVCTKTRQITRERSLSLSYTPSPPPSPPSPPPPILKGAGGKYRGAMDGLVSERAREPVRVRVYVRGHAPWLRLLSTLKRSLASGCRAARTVLSLTCPQPGRLMQGHLHIFKQPSHTTIFKQPSSYGHLHTAILIIAIFIIRPSEHGHLLT